MSRSPEPGAGELRAWPRVTPNLALGNPEPVLTSGCQRRPCPLLHPLFPIKWVLPWLGHTSQLASTCMVPFPPWGRRKTSFPGSITLAGNMSGPRRRALGTLVPGVPTEAPGCSPKWAGPCGATPISVGRFLHSPLLIPRTVSSSSFIQNYRYGSSKEAEP